MEGMERRSRPDEEIIQIYKNLQEMLWGAA
jgi:hypothetical protein